MNANLFTILRSLTLLRQLSLHAGLVDPQYEDVPCAKTDALFEQLAEVVAGADCRFLLDPWWNPATEAQAVDRT